MAYAGDREHCAMPLDDGADHTHACGFAAEHTDWDCDGSHQCECGEVW